MVIHQNYPLRNLNTFGLDVSTQQYVRVETIEDLQEIYLNALPKGTIMNGDGIVSYEKAKDGRGVQAVLSSGKTVRGDVLIGADGIWSAVRATMRGAPKKGEGSGATYSGYTVFAGELAYASPDNGEVGYKVYIGPGQVRILVSRQSTPLETIFDNFENALVLCYY